MIVDYDPVTGRYGYNASSHFVKHEAGFSTAYIDGQWRTSPSWSWTVNRRWIYTGSYIEVLGGSKDWVQVTGAASSVSPHWCYWPS